MKERLYIINLSSVLALGGDGVILVGGDMKENQKYLTTFQLGNEIGLSSYLSDQVEWQECILNTQYDNLSIFSAGPIPPAI